MSAFPDVLPGTDLLINSTTVFNQYLTSDSRQSPVTALADGRFVVTFIDIGGTNLDPDIPEIRARIFNADGTPAGADFLVNTSQTGPQGAPVAAALADGGFVISWAEFTVTPQDPSGGIRAQRFAPDGTKIGTEAIIPDVRFAVQRAPSVETLSNGNLVYVWEHNGLGTTDTDGAGIRARIVTPDGAVIRADFQINSFTDGNQRAPHVLPLQDGGFMVVFQDYSVLSGSVSGEISARVFTANGTPVTGQFRVNTGISSTQFDPQAAQLDNGNIVVAWVDAFNFDIEARIITPGGAQVVGEFTANTTTTGEQYVVRLTALQDGHFMAVWTDLGVGDGSESAIRGQIFNANGEKIGGEVILNSLTAERQSSPGVTTLADGRVMVVWADDSRTAPDLSGAVRGKIIDIRTAAVDLTGTALADDWIGTGFDDTMAGGAGNDMLRGEGGNDRLDGGTGADNMAGGSGDDLFIVDNAGDRTVEAPGAGVDRVLASLSWTLAAEVEDLTLTGSGNLDGFGNSLNNQITGNEGQNLLSGGAGDDTLRGNGGNDRLDGGAGADSMSGGAGDDLFIVDAAGDRTVEAPGAGVDRVLASVSWTLAAEVENLTLTGPGPLHGTGNDLDNRIAGSAGQNRLLGGNGQDALSGLGGNDTLLGGAGGDNLLGGGGADILRGQAGNDVLKGGNGADRLGGGAGRDRIDGGGGNDRLLGHAGRDDMAGGAGRDRLVGGADRDRLDGGGGNDVLIGGALGDTLTGGAGRDTFLFRTPGEVGRLAARDTITDFRSGQDKIDLSGVLDSGVFIGNAAFTGRAGELRYGPTDATLYGDINGDGQDDFQIRLTNAPTISGNDFIF